MKTNDIKETIQRMGRGEAGLHTKTIEPYKIVRTTSLPNLLGDLVKQDLAQKKFEVAKKLKVHGHTIIILRRPE